MARFKQWIRLLKASASLNILTGKSDGAKEGRYLLFWIRLWEAKTLATM